MRRWALVLILGSWASVSQAADRQVETVRFVDLKRYSGKWFEVARLPNRFQRDCIGATAEYSLPSGGKVGIVNTCYREDGSTRAIEGSAETRDDSNSKLRVRFNGFWFTLFSWLIKADYWVIELDSDYRYALVGTPSRDYLWILSRERTMDEATYDRLVASAATQGFDVERILRTEVPANPHE